MLRPALSRLFVGLLALAVAGVAAADARSALQAAFMKNMAAKSYRATITDLATGKEVSTVEYQAPDRYRVRVAGGPTSVIAGGKMHMDVNGRKMSLPVPAGMLDNFRSDAAWQRMQKETLIRDAGAGVVGTEPARKYHWITSGKNASTGDAWVSIASGYVLQVQTGPQPGSKAGSVRVRYSGFGSPSIRIVAPR